MTLAKELIFHRAALCRQGPENEVKYDSQRSSFSLRFLRDLYVSVLTQPDGRIEYKGREEREGGVKEGSPPKSRETCIRS